jgi:glycosyltransferase involved in cell wall biosynthesis
VSRSKQFIIINSQFTIDILVPCYNPQAGWATVLVERYEALVLDTEGKYQLNLILVNDGSTHGYSDHDLEVIRIHIPDLQYYSHTENQGKGAALRTAALQATSEYLVFTDIDFPYTQQSMLRVMEALVAHGGIISGHREQAYYEKVPMFRRILSKLLRWLLKYFLRLPVTDSQCGLKAMDSAGRTVFLETTINRYLFDLEFLQKANGRVAVTPVRVELRDGIIFTSMSFGVLRKEFWNFLKLVF